MTKKKKKPAFGYFCTLNPDAGDVEKVIDIFNNSTSNDIGATGESTGMAEALLLEDEKNPDTEKTDKESKESGETWTDVYSRFEQVVDILFPDVQAINNKVEELYSKHKGEEAWDTAWDKWNTSEDIQQELDALDEGLDPNLYTTTIEDMREGSIGNMDDDDIDFQEKTFSNIARKLKTKDSNIIALKYDDGWNDYNPDYLNDKGERKSDRYGELILLDTDLTFYKEKNFPFLYFKSEADLNDYIEHYNREMGYEF